MTYRAPFPVYLAKVLATMPHFLSRPAGRFFSVSSFQILAMFRRGMFYAYLSVYLRYFLNITVTETTLFATLPMLANIIFQTTLWGRLSDRYQLRRTLIIWGEILGAFGTLAVWYGHTLPENLRAKAYVIILGLTVVEAFWSMSNIGWSALISDLYPAEKRGAIQGKLTSAGGIGRIAGVWIGGLLYDGLGRYYEGWGFEHGALFFVAAGVMLASTLPLLALPEGGVSAGEEDAGEEESGGQHQATGWFVIFLVAMALINFGRNSVVIIQAQYLFLDTGFAVSSQTLSTIVNTESVAMILSGLAVGGILTRMGNGPGVLLGASLGIAYLVLFATTSQLALVYLGSFLKGCAESIVVASSYAFASVLIPAGRRGRRFGLFNATFFLSWGLAGTLIAGPLVDLLMNFGYAAELAYRSAYWSAVAITLSGVILLIVLLVAMRRHNSRAGATVRNTPGDS
jgi:MFS family permease